MKFVEKEREAQSKGSDKRYYEALTPVNDIANGQEYMAAIDWAIKRHDILNVAISGPYGSGKSSVIRSYLNSHKNIKALPISLAAFNLDSMKIYQVSEEKNIKNDVDEKQLEIGILKQLFYSVDADKIPQSRYRKLQSEKKYKNLLTGFLLEILVYVMLYFAFPDKVKAFTDHVNGLFGIMPMFVYWIVSSATWIACILLIEWFRKNGNIQEVKILDKATFKNENGSDESVFNRNMDEIVYFFEATGYQVVIIEDLDRFESTNIFVTLRELNNLLNHYEKIKSKITFIYAIKDDMFEREGERTKFFDFIIPIVPYISSTNSGEILRQKLLFDDSRDKSSIYDISGRFISLISPYISDMRELTCICNEFNIFKNTLKGNQELELIDENMFSLIVFKNLYPKDFAELEDETENSIIRKAFTDKRNLVEKKEDLINAKRQSEAEIIEEIEREALNSVRELKLVLLGCLLNFKSSVKQISASGKTYTIDLMLKDDFDINELRGKQITVYWVNGNSSNYIIVNDIEQEIKKNGGNYFERIERIKKGLAECKEESRRKIEKYEKEINELRTWSVKRIIGRFGTFFLDERVTGNDLLVFFLRHGYIDEHYEDYINYFHPNSITKEEMNFILGVRNHRFEVDYSYPLKNVGQIFDRLQDFEFKQTEVLNYDLVDFVLEKKSESYSMRRLIEQLSNHSAESMDFIKAYIDRGRNIDILIRRLCKENNFFWIDITDDDGISIKTRFRYLDFILMYADIDQIVEQNWIESEEDESKAGKGSLREVINNYPLVLQNIKSVSPQKQLKILNKLDIKFIDVELGGVDEVVKKDIFENCHYDLNQIMIQRLVEWKAPELVKELSTKNYTTIIGLNYAPMVDYVHKNFKFYISKMVIEPESNVDEELNAVEAILERLIFDDTDLCIKILDKEKVIWDDITHCCEKLAVREEEEEEEHMEQIKVIWNYLLSNDRILCTWDNFIAYHIKFGSEEVWGEYFDRNVDVLLSDPDNPSITKNVKLAILLSDITEESFRKFVLNMELTPYEVDLNLLNKTKLIVMIEEHVLPYNIKYWEDMANVAPELRVFYAERNRNDFIASIENIELTEAEINSMLISDAFDSEDKKQILSKIDVSMLSIGTAEVIRGLGFTVDRIYVDAAWSVLPEKDKYELLLNQIDVYKNNELPALFSELAQVYGQLVERTRHKFTFAYSDYNRALLTKLVRRNYLTSAEDEWVEKRNPILFDTEKEHVITGYVKQSKV